MPIDLKAALRKELHPNQSRTFQFQTVGDQLIASHKIRKTVETEQGKMSDVVEVNVLAGEKVDPKTGEVTDVAPGPGSFFLSTHLLQLFDENAPGPDDIYRIKLCEIRVEKRGFKLYGMEFLQRVSPVPTPVQPKSNNSVDKQDDIT